MPKRKTKRVLSEDWRQPPPFALQVELVEGCQLRCGFCGLNGIRGPLGNGRPNELKFMRASTAGVLIEKLKGEGWLPRIEFAMHGEPSLHPVFLEIIYMFRYRLPAAHLMMTSNGGGFLKDPTSLIDEALLDLNVLALDNYESVSIVPHILERYQGRHTPSHYPETASANPHRRRKPSEHDLVIVQDISVATHGTHSRLDNHCGAGAPLNDSSSGKKCARPFREMSVRWDGSVAICCNDWRGVLPVGNVEDMTLDEIWNSDAMRAARRHLYHGLRTFAPCQGCDSISYRPGLLPDQKGQVELPLPTEEDRQVLGKARGDGPLTLPVLREWELYPETE